MTICWVISALQRDISARYICTAMYTLQHSLHSRNTGQKPYMAFYHNALKYNGSTNEHRRDNQKAAQCSLRSVNGRCIVSRIYILCVYFVLHEWPPPCSLHLPKCTQMNENWKTILSDQSHWQIITWMWFFYLLCDNWYFITNPIHMNYQKKQPHVTTSCLQVWCANIYWPW